MPTLTPTQESALTKIAAAAVASELAVPACPAELSCAQAIIESAWGSRIVANNCFGIKATDSSETYELTTEFLHGHWRTLKLAFESYPTLAACFTAHATLLQGGRYAPFSRRFALDHDVNALIDGIGPIYATAPNYAAEVTALARDPHVAAAIAAARFQPGRTAPKEIVDATSGPAARADSDPATTVPTTSLPLPRAT